MNHIKKLYIFITLLIVPSINALDLYYPNEVWEETSPESQNVDSVKVQKLIDLSFEDDSTMSVLIIKNGKIIGEKYAEGYDLNSYGTSWSMAKSFYAALIGISIENGEINSLDDPVSDYLDYFNDERSDITLRDLLDMSSGLNIQNINMKKCSFGKIMLSIQKMLVLKNPLELNLNTIMLIQCYLVKFFYLQLASKQIHCLEKEY